MSTSENKVASYSIVGFGKLDNALAKAFVRKGINVSVATTRHPKSFASEAAEIGPEIIPTTTGGSRQGKRYVFSYAFRVAPRCGEGIVLLARKDHH